VKKQPQPTDGGGKVRSRWVIFQSGKVELVMQSIANHSDKTAAAHSGKCRPFCFVE